jgi:hypothetical protein
MPIHTVAAAQAAGLPCVSGYGPALLSIRSKARFCVSVGLCDE